VRGGGLTWALLASTAEVHEGPGPHALASWQSFYVMLGSSAAALIGLQFVVVALVANIRKIATVATINAFGTPTVAHLGVSLLVSAIMSAPWRSLVALAVALLSCGVGGLGYAVLVIHRVRRQTGYEADWEDWLWYAVVPCSLYGALAVAGSMLPTSQHAAPFVVAAAALGLLFLGIRNSWDSIRYVVAAGGAENPAGQRPLEPPRS
jgi:hypothetical protein